MPGIEIHYYRRDHHVEFGDPQKRARVMGTNRTGSWKIMIESSLTLTRAEKSAVEAWIRTAYEGEIAEISFRVPSQR